MDIPDSLPEPAVIPDATKNLICSPDQLSREQKKELQAYIRRIKKYTDPNVQVTKEEIKTFLSMVFHHWTTADAIPEPPSKHILHKFEYQAVEIGLLTEDAPIPRELLKPGKTHLAASYQTPPERKAGAPVYMLAVVTYPNLSQVFTLVDSRARYFPQSRIKFQYHEGMCADVASFSAMEQSDEFCFYQAHAYNVGVALFHARTRIVGWAAGSPLRNRSRELQMAYPFMAFALFRNNVFPTSRRDPAGRLLSLPRPGIFDLS
ncbi:hypothetical protein TRV_05461 [Trichophyton verrucosum HKI 0517]|uniref:Uncharacterized protein n=1 Tax=Trichophyton verrucosum (strain HKI 0517) TaxID=663202 RepID=D4DE94_TRIVH|nr:uncharacterized protein TRV_05461 [Trichophyton verrucosum HKI 0517]EFE39823.1 hypothetical protein TRV_05461 [Trichophyton verrucosum HKI 0517]